MADTPDAVSRTPDLFPTFDSIEAIVWPGVALAVFVVTAVVVDLMVIIAARWRLVDLPNRRSAHALPTARGGGVAIVATTVLAAVSLAFRWPPSAVAILAGVLLPAVVVAVIGIIDDIQPLPALLRLLIQVAVAAWSTAVLGPLGEFVWPGQPPLPLGAAAWPLTVAWIVGMINAFNFMDGSDGMAALGAVVCGAIIALLGWLSGAFLVMLLAAFVAAASGGFLVFNWQPARVFMGDVGSGFLGTLLATLPLVFTPPALRSLVFVPILLTLCPFILDPLVSVLRRLSNGHNPLVPHREFFFHRLIRSGVSHAHAALLYATVAAIGGAGGLAIVSGAVPESLQSLVPVAVLLLSVVGGVAIEARCHRHLRPAADTAPTPS